MKVPEIKILVVEDDPNLSMILKEYLENLGYNITLCSNGEDAHVEFFNKHYDLCIVDIMLPLKDGYTLVAEIREKNKVVPVIFLTARSLKEDKIKGFKLGCDDYVVKPFSTEELAFRISAILKRSKSSSNSNSVSGDEEYKIGNYQFNYTNLSLVYKNTEQLITSKEAYLLKLLCLHKNKLLTRTYALNTIWEKDDYYSGRSMDVFISKLRKYLQEDERIKIVNLHGNGYKLVIPDDEE